MSAFGCHSLLIKRTSHPLGAGPKGAFFGKYLESGRTAESEALRRVAAAVPGCPKKLWFLSLTVKQDLWDDRRVEVERHYRNGAFKEVLDAVASTPPPNRFLVEQAFASLVIANLRAADGEILAKNLEGFDQAEQAKSLRRLLETFDALRKWEAEP